MNPKLISTLDEIQDNVPVSMTSSFSTVAPFLASAERSYIRQLIGPEQYNALADAYGNAVIPEIAEAISICQKVVANLGYYLAIPVLSVEISDGGLQISSTDTTKNAFQWQVEDIKDSLVELGFNGIEHLLEHLEEYPDLFPEYHASEAYQLQHGCLIRSATDFSRYYSIDDSRYVFHVLQPLMSRIEAQTMVKVLGADFYETLKGDNLSAKAKQLVTQYIKPGLALLTAGKAFVERVITLRDGKVAFNFRGNYNNIKESMPATRDQVRETREQLERDGSEFIADALDYINNNLADFPDFVPPVARRRARFKNDPQKGLFGI